VSTQTLLHIDDLANEALVQFENALELGKVADRQYDDSFAKRGAKIGSALRVREPVQMVAASGRALQVNNIEEKYQDVTVADQRHVAWPFNSADMSLVLDEYSDRYIKPAAAELASVVDIAGHATALTNVYQTYGTPGTDPNSSAIWLNAKAMIKAQGAPNSAKMIALINENAEVATLEAFSGRYNSQSTIGKQFDSGELMNALGISYRMTQNIPKFTTGTGIALGTTSAAKTSGTTISVTGGTANGVVKAGTIFEVADNKVYNQANHSITSQTQQFVVQADVTLNGSGVGDLVVLPEIITTGNYKNMGGVGNGKTITVKSGTTASTSYSQNLLLADKSLALVFADLPKVSAPQVSIKRSKNMSIRIIQTYDVHSDQEIFRLDALFGWSWLRRQFAVRVPGNA